MTSTGARCGTGLDADRDLYDRAIAGTVSTSLSSPSSSSSESTTGFQDPSAETAMSLVASRPCEANAALTSDKKPSTRSACGRASSPQMGHFHLSANEGSRGQTLQFASLLPQTHDFLLGRVLSHVSRSKHSRCSQFAPRTGLLKMQKLKGSATLMVKSLATIAISSSSAPPDGPPKRFLMMLKV